MSKPLCKHGCGAVVGHKVEGYDQPLDFCGMCPGSKADQDALCALLAPAQEKRAEARKAALLSLAAKKAGASAPAKRGKSAE